MTKITDSCVTGLITEQETSLFEQLQLQIQSQGGKINNKISEVTGLIKVDSSVSKWVCLLWVFAFSDDSVKEYWILFSLIISRVFRDVSQCIFTHLEDIKKPLTPEFSEVQIRQFAQVLFDRDQKAGGVYLLELLTGSSDIYQYQTQDL